MPVSERQPVFFEFFSEVVSVSPTEGAAQGIFDVLAHTTQHTKIWHVMIPILSRIHRMLRYFILGQHYCCVSIVLVFVKQNLFAVG